MAYDPYEAINSIYNLKGAWDTANAQGDMNKRNKAASDAQKYYKELRDNGYESVANQLQSSGYDASKLIRDTYAKQGKTSTRDFLKTSAQKYGLTSDQINEAIGFDNDTKEITIGGKKIGKADTIVDGVSYWKDPNVLQKEFDDYIERAGITRDNGAMVKQNNERLWKEWYKQLDMAREQNNSNPYATDEAKQILKDVMSEYGLAAMQGRDNAVADGAASNGGNIDSYAAANALRQQQALIAKGRSEASAEIMASHNARLARTHELLDKIGIKQNENLEYGETYANNEVARKAAESEVTGYVPDDMTLKNNPYFESDGKLKNMDVDYSVIINNAKKQLETAKDPDEIADLKATIRYARQARAVKVLDPRYGEWASTVVQVAPQETANYKIDNKKIDSAERIAQGQNANNLAIAGLESDTALTKAQIDANAATEAARINANADVQTASINANSGSSGGSGSGSYSSNTGSDGTLTRSEVDSIANAIIQGRQNGHKNKSNWTPLTAKGDGTYKVEATHKDYVVTSVMNSDSLTMAQKEYLLKKIFGLSQEQIDNTLNDRRYR